MEKRVKDFIDKHNMIGADDHVILGISGGPDSMALLHIMHKISMDMGFSISVAHVNHCLRPEADEEEKLVKNTCDELGVSFYSGKFQVAEKAELEKKSLEEAGREVRYQFFKTLLEKLNGTLIATAHHQDDNAETVLLHLLRGTGIKGLRGILPVNGNIIRPLLHISKTDIEKYLKENNISYVIDRSNFDPIYLRNRIRYNLIPLLKKEYNPRIVEVLNQLSQIAREDNEVLENEAKRLFEIALIKKDNREIIISSLHLNSWPIALQKRVIMRVLKTLGGETGWEASDIDIILDLATKLGSSKTVHLKKGVNVTKVYDELAFSTKKKETISFDYLLNIPTTISLPTGDKYCIEIVDSKHFKPEKNITYIDYDKCSLPLHLRSRRPGDVFSPLGLAGSKKLKNYFIDLKVPSSKRSDIPLLTSSKGDIYAILGYRVSNLAAVDENSQRILVIKKLN